MRFLYNLIFRLVCLIVAPFYLLKLKRRGNWRENFGERFGKYNSKLKQAVSNAEVIWIHAVSVGEVSLCTQLIKVLEPRVPNVKLVVSTTTTTGMGELKRRLPSHISKIYFPIDLKKPVLRAVTVLRPRAVILVEAEIWPNFIWRLMERKIPLFLVNARLSQRSYSGYRRYGMLFRPLFQYFQAVGAQSEEDAKRLKGVGVREEAIQVVGSLKYDAASLAPKRSVNAAKELAKLGVSEESLVLVGGSTHAGEEEALVDLFIRLKPKFPSLFLLLAPRHFERGGEVGKLLEERGVRFIYRSTMGERTHYNTGELDVLLLNTTGELRFFYEVATLVFIGKSLKAHGGQNPIEAAACGKPVVFGPNMENFAEIAEAFVRENGGVRVRDAEDLERTMEKLLANPQEREALAEGGLRVVKNNLGGMDKTVQMILDRLDPDLQLGSSFRI